MPELVACNLKCRAVSITVRSITGDHTAVSYQTLPGNQPNTNGNYIALWPSTDETIPWLRLPDNTCTVYGDDPSGDLLMAGLALPEDSYVLAYSLASPATKAADNNFCASVFVPSLAPGTEFIAKVMDLEVGDIASYSAVIRYQTLPGYSPKDQANWIGIWDASDSILHDAPLRAMPISKNSDKGEIALNNFKIVSGHSYTVAYFTGGYDPRKEGSSPRNQMACMVTFDAMPR